MTTTEKLAEALRGVDLDGMAEAFHRLIEAQAQKSPFHQPINADAMIALRILRGLIPSLQALAATPAAAPLTREQIEELFEDGLGFESKYTIVREIERACAFAWGVKLAGKGKERSNG